MKVFAGLLSVMVLLSSPALAQSPPRGPAFSWTGCYAGGDIGAAWDSQNVFLSGNAPGNQGSVAGTLSANAFIGGIYAGCNWQFAPAWVLGVEGDISWTQVKDTTSAPNLFFNGAPVGSGGIDWSHNLDRLGSVRGRIGYAVMPNLLLFGTGGLAWAHSSFDGLDAGSGGCPTCRATSLSQTRDGVVWGGGMDWAPWRNSWILRLEYLHYEFPGTVSSPVDFGGGAVPVFSWEKMSVDSVRTGLSYKF